MEKEIMEMLDVANRWSYNPFKKELVCFWWKCVDENGTGYKAKEWFTGLKFTDFLKLAKNNWKRYRVLWFLDNWQFELGCCLEED